MSIFSYKVIDTPYILDLIDNCHEINKLFNLIDEINDTLDNQDFTSMEKTYISNYLDNKYENLEKLLK